MLRVSGEDKLSRSFLSPTIIFSSDFLEKEDLRNKADGLFAQHGVHPSCFSPRRGERLVCVTGWRPGSISWTRFSRIWSFYEHEFDGVRRQDNVKNETFGSSRAILEQKGYFEQSRDGYIKKREWCRSTQRHYPALYLLSFWWKYGWSTRRARRVSKET